jgi:hypothetical protein
MPPPDEFAAAALKPCPTIAHLGWHWYPPVGVFIAVFALLAFAYTLLYEGSQPSKRKKSIWTISVSLLVLLEIRSTLYDRQVHDEDQAHEQCEQLKSFAEIASTLSTDIAHNKEHFDSTVAREEHIRAATEELNRLSTKSLRSITGGDSFGYAVPFSTLGESTSLTLYNNGDEPLTGLNVVVEEVLNDCTIEPLAKCTPIFDNGLMRPFDMGTLGPHQHKPIPISINFDPRKIGKSRYNVRIYAQNGQAIEQIWFKRSLQHPGYAFKYTIIRTITGKLKDTDFHLGSEIFRTLKSVDWTEYAPSESRDGKTLGINGGWPTHALPRFRAPLSRGEYGDAKRTTSFIAPAV